MRRIFLLALVLSPLAGCNGLAFCGYLFAPEERERTVEAEFGRFPARRVAVVVFTHPGVDFAHPRARIDLSNAIAYDLQQNIPDIKMVPADRVLKYQRENPAWDALPRRELARLLGADYVIHLGLEEYSMADQNSGLFRAIITADVNVYSAAVPDAALTPETPEWTGRFRVIYPDDTGRAKVGTDDRAARGEAHAVFAKLLGRKFYQHKVKGGE